MGMNKIIRFRNRPGSLNAPGSHEMAFGLLSADFLIIFLCALAEWDGNAVKRRLDVHGLALGMTVGENLGGLFVAEQALYHAIVQVFGQIIARHPECTHGDGFDVRIIALVGAAWNYCFRIERRFLISASLCEPDTVTSCAPCVAAISTIEALG